MTPRVRRLIVASAALAIALPALYQLLLLASAIGGRATYPYDLEWMEGGMLHHALRIQHGDGLYGPPSVDFIPYLYTPLYPAWLAMLGRVFGLGYGLGRAISILSLLGIVGVATASLTAGARRDQRLAPALVGVACALGLFAAIYPYVEGWYDLARADTLFLFMITAGLAALPWWSTSGSGWRGHARAGAGAALLALAFFCKQTGIFYVAFGGAIVAVYAWRRALTYVGVAAVIGLGGVALLQASTDGWFWTYVSEIHRAHDFNMDRVWASFGNILWHFPALTIVVGMTLVLVAGTWFLRRELPRAAKTFLLWAAAYVVSTIVGAVGWGTEFAHFNAYMPAFLHGALAAGAALPAIAACAELLARSELALPAAGVAALALAATLVRWTWEPARFVPTDADRAAGDRLIARIHALQGDVWMPSHPWYLVLAGKTPHAHRMGIKDVTARKPRPVLGLDDAIAKKRFAALVLDDRDLHSEYQAELVPLSAAIHRSYRHAFVLPDNERPRVYTGAPVVPTSIWLPIAPPVVAPGSHVVFDFEHATWDGWQRSGPAWGDGPVVETPAGSDPVIGATGARFASSMHGGDVATGRITSPTFLIDGARITMRVGGGTDNTKLRVELWVDGVIARTTSVPEPGGDTMNVVSWDVAELHGKRGTLVFVDDGKKPGAHLEVDDVVMWDKPAKQ
jgi:hypothetical protein